MGYAERRSRRLVALLKDLRWWNRVQLWLKFADVPRPPRQLRGLDGGTYVLTGKIARRTYGH